MKTQKLIKLTTHATTIHLIYYFGYKDLQEKYKNNYYYFSNNIISKRTKSNGQAMIKRKQRKKPFNKYYTEIKMKSNNSITRYNYNLLAQ